MSERVGWTVVCRCGMRQFMEVEEAANDSRCASCGNHLMRFKREQEAAPDTQRVDVPICSRCGFACHTICPKCTGVVEPQLAGQEGPDDE